MAKNTHSQEILTGTSASITEHEAADPALPSELALITRPILGEVDRDRLAQSYAPADDKDGEEWPEEDGGDSIQSSPSNPKSSSSSTPSPQQHAPTMESRSSQTPGDNSGVDSTGGSTPETQPQPSAKTAPKGRATPPVKAAPKKQTGARSTIMTGAEDDFDGFD